MNPQVIQWTFLALVSVVGIAATRLLWLSANATRKPSARPSSAGDAWRIEYDSELAEIKSTLAGLSSTLRKLHGRESQRLRKDQSSDASNEIFGQSSKQALRQKYGIVPRVADAD